MLIVVDMCTDRWNAHRTAGRNGELKYTTLHCYHKPSVQDGDVIK